jgi:hypothetical protein
VVVKARRAIRQAIAAVLMSRAGGAEAELLSEELGGLAVMQAWMCSHTMHFVKDRAPMAWHSRLCKAESVVGGQLLAAVIPVGNLHPRLQQSRSSSDLSVVMHCMNARALKGPSSSPRLLTRIRI